jgi:hypothetical protein
VTLNGADSATSSAYCSDFRGLGMTLTHISSSLTRDKSNNEDPLRE